MENRIGLDEDQANGAACNGAQLKESAVAYVKSQRDYAVANPFKMLLLATSVGAVAGSILTWLGTQSRKV